MKKKYRIIVAHPGQQHSFKVASALKKEKMLQRFITAVYDKSDNYVMKLAHAIVKGKDVKKIDGRKNEDLNETEVVTYYTLLSLVVIVFSRFSCTKKFSYWLDRKIADLFGKRVAKYAIRHEADAVICFSMNERVCFEYLKKHAPDIRRIVDCANSPVRFMRDFYELDCEKEGLKQEVPSFWNENELLKQQKGLEATQFFLAPSNFVKNGLIYCGVNENKIFVLPYGSNFERIDKPQCVPQKVSFIYVGQVTYRKGVHYLLKAFSELEIYGITLDVIGSFDPNSTLYQEYKNKKNIIFHGHIAHEEVKEYLMSANVFVFDSLTEGLSLACLEALSCGLPIICSTNSGVNDFISDGYNGFVVKPDSVECLKEKVIYFYNHPEQIPRFSSNAIETVAGISWEIYQTKLKDTITAIFN